MPYTDGMGLSQVPLGDIYSQNLRKVKAIQYTHPAAAPAAIVKAKSLLAQGFILIKVPKPLKANIC